MANPAPVMGRQYVGSEVNSIGPKGIFLNAHGDPTPSDADRPAKEGAASGHFAAVEAEIRGLRAILEPIKSQCWLFLCVLSKQRWGGRNDSDWSIFEDHCWRRDAVGELWFTPCAG